MAFATSPSSANSIFSFGDSTSDVAALDMHDDRTKPTPDKEAFEFGTPTPVEGSLNSSMITVVVSLQGMLAVYCLTDIFFYRSATSNFALILTFFKKNRRH